MSLFTNLIRNTDVIAKGPIYCILWGVYIVCVFVCVEETVISNIEFIKLKRVGIASIESTNLGSLVVTSRTGGGFGLFDFSVYVCV